MVNDLPVVLVLIRCLRLFLIISVLLTGFSTPSSGAVISGKISAPVVLSFVVYSIEAVEVNGNGYFSSTVMFNNSTSQSYSITIPDDPTLSWRVMYMEDDVYGFVTGYYRAAYYAMADMTWKIDESAKLTGKNGYSGINLTVIDGPTKTIQGTISLPEGVSSLSAEVGVDIYDAEGHVFTTTWKDFLSGDTSVDYTVDVPEGTTETWKVGYHIASQDIGDLLVKGYFTSACTVWTYSEAVDLPASQDYGNIDMSLIRTTDTCSAGSFPWAQFLPAIFGMGSR